MPPKKAATKEKEAQDKKITAPKKTIASKKRSSPQQPTITIQIILKQFDEHVIKNGLKKFIAESGLIPPPNQYDIRNYNNKQYKKVLPNIMQYCFEAQDEADEKKEQQKLERQQKREQEKKEKA